MATAAAAATSTKKSLTSSHDQSTDTDDDIRYDSDSTKDASLNPNDESTSTKRLTHKMKPCLVHRTSTSDEELQDHLIAARIGEQPPHGILKVPSGTLT